MIHSGLHEDVICELYPFMTSKKEINCFSTKTRSINDDKYFFF